MSARSARAPAGMKAISNSPATTAVRAINPKNIGCDSVVHSTPRPPASRLPANPAKNQMAMAVAS